MLARLAQKESQTVTILSRYLAQIITQSATHDPHALEQSLRSIISPAIAQEIAENKDKMIDALYPIMGGMISKYVTQAIKEMMEKINDKIEQGLSVERYKRKFKAKLTGVSETELLLEESSDATIESIFIIHKETGLLIAEANNENSEIDDPHMVASMASAIKDFVNDWISNQAESGSKEVQLLSYGDATLYIESAGSVYLIAFLDSEPDHEQRKEINLFFAQIIKRYSTLFQEFEGDDSDPRIAKVEAELLKFLNTQSNGTKKQKRKEGHTSKIVAALLIGTITLGAGLFLKEKYGYYVLEKRIQQRTGERISLHEEDGRLYLKGELREIDHLGKIRAILQKQTDLPIINALYMPIEEISRKFKMQQRKLETLQQSEQALHTLQKKTQKLEASQSALTAELKAEQARIAQLTQSMEKMEKRLQKALSKPRIDPKTQAKIDALRSMNTRLILAVARQHYNSATPNPKNGALTIQSKDLFEAGSVVPNPELIESLKEDIGTYIDTIINTTYNGQYLKHIIIKGYTDTSGSQSLNQRLSSQRAEEIKRYILSLPIAKKHDLSRFLVAEGMGEQDPIIVNGVEDKEASRRIELSFQLDQKKINRELSRLRHH